MSWVATGVTAAVAIYGIYQQGQNAKAATSAAQGESDRQYNLQLQQEKQLKDKQANDDALEASKVVRARRQALMFGGSTKNGTINTSPTGVPGTALGVGSGSTGGIQGGKTLLGM